MVDICTKWKIPFINLSELSSSEAIQTKLLAVKPKIILCSIEDINTEEKQSALQNTKISYIAVDECQVECMIEETSIISLTLSLILLSYARTMFFSVCLKLLS